MREVLELSKETYNLLVNMVKERQRSLEEMLRICLVAYEERCAQHPEHQMLA